LSYLRIAYNKTESDKDDYGEYANRKDFILWAHSPVMLLANFIDVKQITLIRKPEDVVPSICNKVCIGIGSDVFDGIQYRSKFEYDDLEEFMA
jgi:hypothetical protein